MISPRALLGPTPFLVLVLLLACNKDKRIVPEGISEIQKKDRIDLAIAQEVEMTKDPSTGKVPKDRLYLAHKTLQARKQLVQDNYSVNWAERGPDNVGGRTRAILIDANDPNYETVWAGSVGGGLWMCTNISATNPNWTAVNDFFNNMAITCIAQDPNNPNTMYFATGEGFFNADAIRGMGIWKSTNGGTSWGQLSSTDNNIFHYCQKMEIRSNGDLFVATRNGGIQKSTDGGSSWSKVLGSGQGASTNRAADIEIAANGDLYAGMGIFSQDGLYKSTDNGNSWTKLTNGLPSSGYYRVEVACAPSDANRLYVLFHDSGDNSCEGIYRSSDGGSSFTSVANPSTCTASNFCRNQAWYDIIAAVDPNDKDRLFIGGVDLMVSSDGGNSFSQISQWYGGCQDYVHADHHTIVFEPGNSDNILFGNDGGVFRTTNGSSSSISFNPKNDGYNVTQFYGCAIDPGLGVNHFLAGSQDNGSHLFDQSGTNSTTEVTGGDGAFCHIDQDEPTYQFTSYVYSNYYRSTDGGNTFSSVSFGDNGRFINPTDYDDTADIFYGAYNDGTYFRWDDPQTGSTWYSISISDFSGKKVSAVTCSPNTANRVFFGLGNGNVVKVDNAHNSSHSSTVIRSGSGYVSCIEVEQGDDDHILVTYSNYGVNSVWETTDGGSTWNSVEGDLPDMPVRWALFNPHDADQALLATELGVWYSDDLNAGSTNWVPANNGLANVRTDMLQLRSSDNEIIASTHGRGLFSTSSFATALPVEWLSFSVKADDQNVELNWSTANEQQNEGFEVQRSSDGKNYGAIGWKKGLNNTNSTSHYTFIDEALPKSHQRWFYRLKQEDIDGGESFSEIRYVYLNTLPNEVHIWPNPAEDLVNISVKKSCNYSVYDENGQRVLSGQINKDAPKRLEVSSLGAGVYWCVLENEYFRSVEKIVISR